MTATVDSMLAGDVAELTESELRGLDDGDALRDLWARIPEDAGARHLYSRYLMEVHGGTWVGEVIGWVRECEPEEEFLVGYLADLGWAGRSCSRSATPQIPKHMLVRREPKVVRFAYAYLALQAARFDFDYRLINRILGVIDDDEAIEYSNFGEGFAMFAALAEGADVDVDAIERLAKPGANVKLQHLVLHGMWLYPGDRYGEQLVQIGTRLIRSDARDANAWMRRAEGHRRLGEHREAVEALDTAISLLDENSREVHADFVRQRMMVTYEMGIMANIDEKVAAVEAVIAERGDAQVEKLHGIVDEHSNTLKRQFQDMMFRIMEVIALFVALIGVLAATIGTSLAAGLSLGGRIAILASASIFLVFFFVMIHVLARPRAERTRKDRT